MLIVLFAIAALLLAWQIHQKNHRIQQLERELARAVEKRNADRTGRIRAEVCCLHQPYHEQTAPEHVGSAGTIDRCTTY
jgi:hypothetical protein